MQYKSITINNKEIINFSKFILDKKDTFSGKTDLILTALQNTFRKEYLEFTEEEINKKQKKL